MRPYFGPALRFLLLCVPQLALSALSMGVLVWTFSLPGSLVGLHLTTLLPLNLLFFWAAAGVTRRGGPHAPSWFPAAYATALFFKAVAINVVFAACFASNAFWGSYLSWHNLSALGPHLRGFYLVFGVAAVFVMAGFVLLLAGYFFLLQRHAPRLVRWLHWTFAVSPGDRIAPGRLVLVCGLVAAIVWSLDLDPAGSLRQDPLFCFWTNRAATKPQMTQDMMADVAGAGNYVLPATFRRRDVVIISIDCMRADHLSFRGYARETMPYLSSLASSGQLHAVDFSVSNGNDSPQGLLAMLGSCYPHRQNLNNFKLPDLLKLAGYRTHIIGTGDHTTLGELRKFYGPNIDFFSDGLSQNTVSVNDDLGVIEALERMPAAGGQPGFFLIHLMSPHSLGTKEAEFGRWQPALLRLEWRTMIRGGVRPDVMTNTYDNGLLQADHYLRRVMELLRAKGYLKDYTGVITGDHGGGLGERGNFGHTRHLFMEDMNVPLLFFDSEQVDYGSMPFGSTVDIAPTLLDRLDLPAP